MEDDAYALPVLPGNVQFAAAFAKAEASLMASRKPYLKLFSSDRYYRFGFDDLHSYFVLGSLGIAFAILIHAILAPLKKLRNLTLSTSCSTFITAGSVLVGVVCGVWVSRPVLFPSQSGVIDLDDYCCSQAHLYAGGNSSVTRGVAQALLDAVDRVEMYDVSLADMWMYGKVTQRPLAHRPSLFGHSGVASSKSGFRTHFIDHIEE